jgi:hypothetical protein
MQFFLNKKDQANVGSIKYSYLTLVIKELIIFIHFLA